MTKFAVYLAITLVFAFYLNAFEAKAQADTIKIMSYNTLNYDIYDGSCPTNINALKNKYLRDIIKYVNPDILGLVKMNQDPSFVNDSIPKFVLDSVCKGCWDHGVFTDYSHYSKGNQLYFKTSKFGFLGTKTIYSADASISDINMHQLYIKDSTLAKTHDTIFLNIILVHDLSGSTSAAQRTSEIGGAMAWLDANVKNPGNYIFMGDFNVTSSNEGCFQAMLSPSNSNVKFNEPTGQLGNWSSNPAAFSKYINNSTRTATLSDCGASGGLTDWFDHILCSDYIMNGSDALTYVPGSFTVIAQDGNHTKNALISAPADTIVPSQIVKDVYNMSNHMPVSLKLGLNPKHHASISENTNNYHPEIQCYFNNEKLEFNTLDESLAQKKCILTVFDCLGKTIVNTPLNIYSGSGSADLPYLKSGCYFLSLVSDNQIIYRSKVIKM